MKDGSKVSMRDNIVQRLRIVHDSHVGGDDAVRRFRFVKYPDEWSVSYLPGKKNGWRIRVNRGGGGGGITLPRMKPIFRDVLASPTEL